MNIYKEIENKKNELIGKLIYSEEKSSFRWIAVWEGLLFIVATLLVDAIFFDGSRFVEAGFHPFWLFILLITALYGLSEGLVIVFIATIFLYAGNMPLQKITENQYEYFLRVVSNPIMWLLIVFFIGSLRDRETSKIIALKKQADLSDEKSKEISEQYEKVANINTLLESKLATNGQTIVTVYNSIKNMETSSLPNIIQGASDLIHTIISPQKFSIFLLNNDSLTLQYNKGWADDDRYDDVYTLSSPLYNEIVNNHRSLYIANPEDERFLENSIIAVPIIHDLSGEVFGMLKIESIPFSNMGQHNVNSLMVVGRWLANALYQQKMVKIIKSKSMEDPELNVMTATFYEKMEDFTKKLGERCKFDVSAISLAIENQELDHEENIKFSGILSDAVKESLRYTDLLFISPTEELSYSILLPNTDLKGASVVMDKINSSLKKKTHHHNIVKHSVKVIYENTK